LAELLGAEMQVESEWGEQGERVYLHLACVGDLEAMKARILLIEDNEQNRYMTTFLLEQNGFQVVCAPDGPAGIHLAAGEAFDLILLDIQLPGMDGYAVARELRRNPDLQAVPIVAVTSYAMVGDREMVLAAGCDGYLEKPINPDNFVAEISSYLPVSKGKPSELND
jgi:two-component system cell cycle response regulator DivK